MSWNVAVFKTCGGHTGSLDYTIRIYDFNGMKSDMRAFR